MRALAAAGLLAALVILWLTPQWALAHQLPRPKPVAQMTLVERAAFQERALAHARGAVRFLERRKFVSGRTASSAWRELRFHRAMIRWTTRELAETRALLVWQLAPIPAIQVVFGARADEAIDVAGCETGGTFSVYARNGQYLGLFQMGSRERATYGHSWTAYGQARAAHRYFVASGSDWSPWECKP